MTEFIINSDQLEQLIEGIEHKTDREINRVVCDGKDLPSIVRCKDCKFSEVVTDCYSDKSFLGCNAEWCEGSEGDHPCVEPNGFCMWGERKEESE